MNMRRMVPKVFIFAVLAAACGQTDPSAESNLDAVVGAFGGTTINPRLPTHIIAVGYSNGQADQFVRAAIGRAQKYRDLFPQHQIVLLGHPEIDSSTTDREAFQRFDIHVTEYRPEEELNSYNLTERLRNFQSIASFDFYGHSSPWAIGISSRGARLGTDTDEWQVRSLADHFATDSYATLNGCNAGLYLAPHLSKLWKIPVAGAATGTNFQQLHQNGRWYFNDRGNFPEGRWATNNTVSFKNPMSCSKGGCTRIKPENSPYKGHWSTETAAGLGFLKFFCPGFGDTSRCQRGMALSLIAYESLQSVGNDHLDISKFEKVVFDYLCPNDRSGRLTSTCQSGIRKGVDSGNETFSVFSGQELKCSFDGCQFSYKCEQDPFGNPVPGTCKLSAPSNPNPTNLVKEYKALMSGFRSL